MATVEGMSSAAQSIAGRSGPRVWSALAGSDAHTITSRRVRISARAVRPPSDFPEPVMPMSRSIMAFRAAFASPGNHIGTGVPSS